MTLRLLGVVALLVVCSPAQVVNGNGKKIMIFGGQKHDVYLGCLSCSEYARDSVLNEYGPYGSEFSQDSIWNSFSKYGSEFSNLSVCNSFATDPPVIVDNDGSFYGRLTLNESHRQIGSGKNLISWLQDKVCK